MGERKMKPSGMKWKRCLVIEDHPAMQDSLSRALKGAGFEMVGRCKAAEEARAYIRLHAPALVITDIEVPGGGIFELVREFESEQKNTVFIIYSAYDTLAYLHEALEHPNIVGYLKKSEELKVLADFLPRLRHDGQRPYLFGQVSRLWKGPELKATKACLDELEGPERAVFDLLGSGLTPIEIAERLSWTMKKLSKRLDELGSKVLIAIPEYRQLAETICERVERVNRSGASPTLHTGGDSRSRMFHAEIAAVFALEFYGLRKKEQRGDLVHTPVASWFDSPESGEQFH
jgi:DNA-binding NarL/FixJ family response regulator